MAVTTTTSTTTAAAEKLRSERGLRALTPAEEGLAMQQLPNGIFGFSFAPGYSETPVYSRRPYQCFELHKLENGEIHVIGLVTPEDKEKLGSGKEATVSIYPEPFKSATELVSVADRRIAPARKAVAREDGNPFRSLIYPA